MMNITQWLIAIDVPAVLTGLLTGTLVSVAYFVGLVFSIRIIRRRSNSVLWFIVSALSRIVVLIGAGWLISVTFGRSAVISYGFAFLYIRYMATILACRWPHKDMPTCN